MRNRPLFREISLGVVLGVAAVWPALALGQESAAPVIEEVVSPVEYSSSDPGHLHGVLNHIRGYVDPENAEVVSMEQLGALISDLEKRLQYRGRLLVKGPDVWGQNRMTQYRGEYEDQMKTQLANFEIILSSYQRRADLAALTNATSIGAVAPRISGSRNVSTTTNVTPAVPSAAGLIGSEGMVANANSLIGTMSPLLMPDKLTSLALSNKAAAPGIGLEPTVVLDERSRFLNHLHELRRINLGDDRSDLPGYSLYLLRVPVSILPGQQTVRGKGAAVTMEAKHHLTPDLLANTMRQVVLLDTAYQLMDMVTCGQYLPIGDDEDCGCIAGDPQGDCKIHGSTGGGDGVQLPNQSNSALRSGQRSLSANMINGSGKLSGGQGQAPGSETVAILGWENLKRLTCAVKTDQASWYRHDPSVVSWLMNELASAHTYMREQARIGNALFQPSVFETMGELALMRNYRALAFHREQWLQALAKDRNELPLNPQPLVLRGGQPVLRVRPIDILAFAIMVQSVMVDRQLKHDMRVMAERRGCNIGEPDQYCFYDLNPDEPSKQAFMTYVQCKWPIHVFSLDPMVDQQNQLDLFSQRSELQMALAAAVSSGQVDFKNASSYARRLEQDLGDINLNRTALGFGAGETTFGWQFRPRFQTPPTPGNVRRIAGLLLNNGTGPDYELKNLQIEPGLRECYALMVVPNFIPMMKLTTITNWFELKTHHPAQKLDTSDMLRLSRKYQTARDAMQRLCDSSRYRPVDLELLGDRLTQLESLLPMQSHRVVLPYEADLTGSEIFSSTTSGLSPRLLTWYGEAARPGGSIFILGSGFIVRDMKVIVGGVTLKDPSATKEPGQSAPSSFDLMSRNVLRIDIPSDARAIKTPVVFQDPAFQCNHGGRGLREDGTCGDCSQLRAQSSEFGVAERAVDSVVEALLEEKAQGADKARMAQVAKLVAAAVKAVQTPKTAIEGAEAVAAAAASAAATSTANTQSVVDAATAAAEAFKASLKGSAPKDCECKQRWVIDVHVANSNGISNHLLVEVAEPVDKAAETKAVSTIATTTVKTNSTDGSVSTTTEFKTTPPGIVLPMGTILPMGGNLPAAGTIVAPGAVKVEGPPPPFLPGTVPNTAYPPSPHSSIEPKDMDPVALQTPTAAPDDRRVARSAPNLDALRPVAAVPTGSAGAIDRGVPGSVDPAVARASAFIPGPVRTPRDVPQAPTDATSAGSPPPKAEAIPAPRKSVLSRMLGRSR